MTSHAPESVLDAYREAVFNRSAEAFLGLYADDARVFDTWVVWSYEGTESRRAAIEGWFSSLGEERVQVTFEDVKCIVTQELAVLTATGRYAAVSGAGQEVRSMQNRFTWALRRRADRWVIEHEHTSTPIGSSDLKAILHRN